MAERFRRILRGASTVVVVWPDPDREIVSRPLYRPVSSSTEAIADAWREAGQHIRSAMDLEFARVLRERQREDERTIRAG